MKNIIFLFLLNTLFSFAQNENIVNDSIDIEVEKLYKKIKIQEKILDLEFNNFLYYPVKSLKENIEINKLKVKLNSDLNNVISCSTYYIYSSEFNLNENEQLLLKFRIEDIGHKLLKNKKPFLIRLTGGYAPVCGIDSEIIKNKEIPILLFAKDCVVDDFDKKQEEIYKVFNEAVLSSINK